MWFFFSSGIKAKDARTVAKLVISRVGESPPGLTREIFPREDRLKSGGPGSLIKLPLGFHGLSHRRSLFLAENEALIADQASFLQNIRVHSPEEVYLIFRFGSSTATAQNMESKAAPATTPGENYHFPQEWQKDFPAAIEILKGCNLVRHLVQKAKDTSYLSHFERLSLLHIFSHLGSEGQAFLHRVMACCINYRSSITEKYLQRAYDKPISCPRLREEYPDLTARLGCDCRLVLQPKGYPSPVLHALRFSRRAVVNMPFGGNKDNVDNQEISADVNQLAKRLIELRKQQRGIARSLAACETKMNELFQSKGVDRIEIELGTLVRVPADNSYEWTIEL